jgi:hypothetical protein
MKRSITDMAAWDLAGTEQEGEPKWNWKLFGGVLAAAIVATAAAIWVMEKTMRKRKPAVGKDPESPKISFDDDRSDASTSYIDGMGKKGVPPPPPRDSRWP